MFSQRPDGEASRRGFPHEGACGGQLQRPGVGHRVRRWLDPGERRCRVQDARVPICRQRHLPGLLWAGGGARVAGPGAVLWPGELTAGLLLLRDRCPRLQAQRGCRGDMFK